MKNLSKSELVFFIHLKDLLNNEQEFEDVLKVFHLYVECVIGADELLMLVEKFFENDPEDHFERFKMIIFS